MSMQLRRFGKVHNEDAVNYFVRVEDKDSIITIRVVGDEMEK